MQVQWGEKKEGLGEGDTKDKILKERLGQLDTMVILTCGNRRIRHSRIILGYIGSLRVTWVQGGRR